MKTRSLTVRLPEAIFNEIAQRAKGTTKTEVMVQLLSQALGIKENKATDLYSQNRAWRLEIESRLEEIEKKLDISETQLMAFPFSEITPEKPKNEEKVRASKLLKMLREEEPDKNWNQVQRRCTD